MSTVDNCGVQIYYEVAGETGAEPVVLQHGFSDSLESWKEYGYVDALAKDFSVVLIDARGHGKSDKPHAPEACELSVTVADVVAVLDAIGIDKAHFYGYSMGGRYAFGMARHAPERLRSLMIGGIAPWRVLSRVEAFVEFLKGGAESFITAWEAQAPISDALKERLRSNDAEALIAWQRQRARHADDDDVAAAVPRLNCPYRLIAGDQDALMPYSDLVRYSESLPAGSLITLPGLNHLETMQQADVVLPHLLELFGEASA